MFVGGCRSGKSRVAEEFVVRHHRSPCYVATMTGGTDPELRSRIELHRQRRGDCWRLIEEPTGLAELLAVPPIGVDALLIDCLTMWLTNLLLADFSDKDIADEVERLVAGLAGSQIAVVLVANEVGLGIVPDSPLGRRFRDLAGGLNQRLAAVCERVVFVAAGLPLCLKDV